MIVLWVSAGVLSAAAAGLVLHRAARAALDAGSTDPTLAVYRRQLAEIDDLAGRGLIAEDERKTAHAEAARRLLNEADRDARAWTAPASQRRPVLGAAVLACAAALATYLVVGSPTAADRPLKARIAEWRGSDLSGLTAPQMAAVLRVVTREHPDPDGYRFLAVAENQSENPSGAARALRKAITLAPDRADLWEMLGVSLVAEAQGEETPAALTAFRQALSRDPRAVLARFHLARAQAQAGDKAGAVASLKALQTDMPLEDPRRQSLSQAIAEAQADDAPASAQAGGQIEMIRGMVAGLAAKLKANPDDPEGWERLVKSYAVLGDSAARDAALTQAKARYRGRADVVGKLDAAARTEPMK